MSVPNTSQHTEPLEERDEKEEISQNSITQSADAFADKVSQNFGDERE
jgi:hypothetical protein